MIPLGLFILLLLAIALCFASNRDIFSPGKFYHGFLVLFFADVFLSEQNGYVYAVYLGFVFAGMLMSLLEAYTLSRRRSASVGPEPCRNVPGRFVVRLWIASIVPVLAQCYLIHITGGVGSLAVTIAHRVVEWRGLGPLIMLIKLIAPINLVYFAVGLAYTKRNSRVWWSVYLLHLFLFLAVAVLQGSRGFVFIQFVFMAVVYHYLKRPIKLRYALLAGTTMVFMAAFLGTVRNNLTRLERFGRLSEMHGDTLNLKILSYGTNPLDVVFSREFTDYQYGKTFLTPVTNFVPRKIWPDKFDSGGVVLTKFWRGRSYTGLTHMSTGLVAEGIINFGYPFGMLAGFAILLTIMLMTFRYYVYFRRQLGKTSGVILVLLTCIYAYIASIAGDLLYGEFQNHVGGLCIKCVLLFLAILLLRLRLVPVNMFPNCMTSTARGLLEG